MKKTWILACLCILLFGVTACAPDRSGQLGGAGEGGNGGSSSNNGASVNSEGTGEQQPDKLVIWSNDDAKHLKVVEQLAGEFAADTGIQVEVVPVSGSEQVQKLSLAAPAGNGPDLFYQPQDRLGDLAVQGLAEPVELSQQERAEYSTAALDAVQYEGQTYGFPISIETYALYYNKALVDQPPVKMEDIAGTYASLTDAGQDRYAFLMVPDFYYAIPFIMNYGGYIFGQQDGKYDASDLGLNNEGAVQGMSAYASFVKETGIPATMTTDVMDTLFLEGKAAMTVNGLWAMKPYADKLGDDLGTAPLPTVNGEPAPSFVGVKSWFISSYSKHPEWAKRLALHLTNAASSEVYYEQTGEIPARPDAQQSIVDPLYDGFVQQLDSGVPMPNIPEMSTVWAMDDAVDFIVQGEDPKSVLDETTGQIASQIKASGR